MNLLAIDPSANKGKYGTRTGLARFDNDWLIGCYTLTWDQVQYPKTRAEWIEKVDALVIETEHLRYNNPQVMRKLIESRMLWEVQAQILGKPVYHVAPQEWMRALNRGWKFGKKSKKDLVAFAKYIHLRWKNHWVLSPDEISAIGIGTYWIDKQKMGG